MSLFFVFKHIYFGKKRDPKREKIFRVCNKVVVLKEANSVSCNIFRNFLFLFKSFVKIELVYVFTINMFSTAENARKNIL